MISAEQGEEVDPEELECGCGGTFFCERETNDHFDLKCMECGMERAEPKYIGKRDGEYVQ